LTAIDNFKWSDTQGCVKQNVIPIFSHWDQCFFSEENRRGSGASTENLLKTTKKVATKQNKTKYRK
jgi:hypothetical protein